MQAPTSGSRYTSHASLRVTDSNGVSAESPGTTIRVRNPLTLSCPKEVEAVIKRVYFVEHEPGKEDRRTFLGTVYCGVKWAVTVEGGFGPISVEGFYNGEEIRTVVGEDTDADGYRGWIRKTSFEDSAVPRSAGQQVFTYSATDVYNHTADATIKVRAVEKDVYYSRWYPGRSLEEMLKLVAQREGLIPRDEPEVGYGGATY